jgi:hypothetical protein
LLDVVRGSGQDDASAGDPLAGSEVDGMRFYAPGDGARGDADSERDSFFFETVDQGLPASVNIDDAAGNGEPELVERGGCVEFAGVSNIRAEACEGGEELPGPPGPDMFAEPFVESHRRPGRRKDRQELCDREFFGDGKGVGREQARASGRETILLAAIEEPAIPGKANWFARDRNIPFAEGAEESARAIDRMRAKIEGEPALALRDGASAEV